MLYFDTLFGFFSFTSYTNVVLIRFYLLDTMNVLMKTMILHSMELVERHKESATEMHYTVTSAVHYVIVAEQVRQLIRCPHHLQSAVLQYRQD